ncbi:unnamed protein product, partial [Rotaria sordida]
MSVVRVQSQICHGISEYDQCSSNSACACFHMAGTNNTGICGFQWVTCSELRACEHTTNHCHESDHICIRHPRCHNHPVCYPVSMIDQPICPPITMIPNIPANARWAQNGVTVAGGHEPGNSTNQLFNPWDLFVDDDDQTMVIADRKNHRIVQWKIGDTNGQVVAGGTGQGNRLDQLDTPIDVLIDKKTDSLIISERGNRRVVRWSRRSGTIQGEILIDNIDSYGLVTDGHGYLYISNALKHEVRRYQIGDKNGTIVAGGHGKGTGLNQLNYPHCIFVDQQQTVYVSDTYNHRVMKWNKGAKEGIVVAGGQGEGNALTQLLYPNELVVDRLGTLYIADSLNHRVIRWPKGAIQGTVIVGGNGKGARANQFNSAV